MGRKLRRNSSRLDPLSDSPFKKKKIYIYNQPCFFLNTKGSDREEERKKERKKKNTFMGKPLGYLLWHGIKAA